MELPPEAAALLALPPARFTAERNALAQALAARRDPAAGVVRKLARPVGLAWVLNRLARDRRREVRALLEAGDRLRAGQRRAVSGAGAEALRAAEAEVREQARALRHEAEKILAAEGRAAPTAALARIELLLRVAATGSARAELEAGTLAREPAPGDAELSGLTVVAGGTDVIASAPPSRPPSPPRPARGARERADRGQAAREARDARDAEQRRKERVRAVKAAHAAAAQARARAEKEERAAEKAEALARTARERAAAARGAANQLAARAMEVERAGHSRER